MGTTLSLIFHRLATKFSNLVQKKNPRVQGLRETLNLTFEKVDIESLSMVHGVICMSSGVIL